MPLKVVVVAFSMFAWPMSSVVAAPASSFCPQLQAIVDDVPRDFALLRGRALRVIPDDGGGESAERFTATLWLPGATTCGVDDMRSDGDRVPSLYLCWFPADRSSTKAVERIARDVTQCIDPGSTDHSSAKLDGASFDLQRKGFVLSITAERDQSVILAISGK